MNQEKTEQKQGLGKYTGYLLTLLFIAPMIGAWIMFEYFPNVVASFGTTNHGNLVSPIRDVDITNLRDMDGNKLDKDFFAHKWTMLYIDNSECDQVCQYNLNIMRQIRLAQGKEMQRVERLFVLTDTRNQENIEKIQKTHEGMTVTSASNEDLQDFIKTFTLDDKIDPLLQKRIYMVDLYGKLMMYYKLNPEDASMKAATGMRKDLAKLLYNSKNR